MAVDYQSSFLDSCSSHGSWTAAQPSWAHVRFPDFGSYFHPCTWHWFIATNACCNVWRALIFSLVEPYGTNLKGSPQESTTRCPCRTISRWSLVKHCWYDQQQTTKLAFNQKYSVYLWGRKVSFHTCTHTHTHTHTRTHTRLHAHTQPILEQIGIQNAKKYMPKWRYLIRSSVITTTACCHGQIEAANDVFQFTKANLIHNACGYD